MAFGTRVWSAGKLLLLVGALVATFVLLLPPAMRLALRAREVQVPDLTNRTANEATAVAAELGLAVRVDETRRPDPKVAAGRVLAQDPPPGTVRGSSAACASGSAPARAPPRFPRSSARPSERPQLRLREDGLELVRRRDSIGVVSRPTSSSHRIRRRALPAATWRCWSTGPSRRASYVMPDLIGVNGDRAAAILREHGFRVAVVGSTPYPGVAAGIVLRQSPQAGFQIAPGEPISIEVSR